MEMHFFPKWIKILIFLSGIFSNDGFKKSKCYKCRSVVLMSGMCLASWIILGLNYAMNFDFFFSLVDAIFYMVDVLIYFIIYLKQISLEQLVLEIKIKHNTTMNNHKDILFIFLSTLCILSLLALIIGSIFLILTLDGSLKYSFADILFEVALTWGMFTTLCHAIVFSFICLAVAKQFETLNRVGQQFFVTSFNTLLDQYLKLNDFAERLSDIYSIPLFLYIGKYVYAGLSSTNYFLLENRMDKSVLAIFMIMCLFFYSSQLVLICVAGSFLEDESRKFSKNMMNGWIPLDKEQRHFLITLKAVDHRATVVAGKLIPINRSTVIKIMGTVLTYITICIQLIKS